MFEIKKSAQLLVFLIGILLFSTVELQAQTTAFNFQGRLNDGANPANGRYDLQFKLYDAIEGGTLIVLTERLNTVLINGVFSVKLDFGSLAFANGADRFLEIGVRPNGSPNPYIVLGARQQFLSVPFAVRSINTTNADNAVNATNATTAQNSLSLGGVAASNYAQLNIINSGDLKASGNFAINGNAQQSVNSSGLVKAMVVVNDDLAGGGTVGIERCYNGITGSSAGNCGFAVSSSMPGVYQVNFGFPVNNRFVSAIGRYNSGSVNTHNIGANYQFPSTNTSIIEIFTFASGNSDDTLRADFTVIVY